MTEVHYKVLAVIYSTKINYRMESIADMLVSLGGGGEAEVKLWIEEKVR